MEIEQLKNFIESALLFFLNVQLYFHEIINVIVIIIGPFSDISLFSVLVALIFR